MSDNKLNKELIKKRILPTLLISSLLPLMICISVPFEIYSNNLSEFVFSLSDFLWLNILFAILFTAVIFFILLFLPGKSYRIVSAIFIALSVMIYIQGTYLNGSINSLGGDNLSTRGASKQASIINLIIWLAIITTIIVLSFIKDKKGILSLISIVLCLMIFGGNLIVPVSLSITNKDIFLSKAERLTKQDESVVNKIATTKNLNHMSNSNNIFYFIVDRFDESYAEKMIEKDSTFFDNLNGFTWFKDNISIYGHTYPAVANMLTKNNQVIENSREKNLENMYKDNHTLSVLAENGYDVNIYSQQFYAFNNAGQLPNYVTNILEPETYKVERPFTLSMAMMGMAMFRGSPLMLKWIYGDVNSNTCNETMLIETKDKFRQYSCNNSILRNYALNTEFKAQDRKIFSFIHFDGCHGAPHSKPYSSLEESFDIINKYIDEMKKIGIYKNSTIIITGDHSAPFNNLTAIDEPRLTALFFKPSGVDEGKVKISLAQTSHDDIWATIMQSEGITSTYDYGKSLFEIPEGENRERRFIWHTYGATLNEYTYKIVGAGRDMNNWKEVNKKSFDKAIVD